MRKTLICVPFLLMITALITSLPGVAKASPMTSIEIVPASLERLSGDSFIINVTVNDVTNLYLWMFRLKWNNTVLRLNSIQEGPFLKKGGGSTSGLVLSPSTVSEINDAGRINEATCSLLGGVPGVSGSGTIASLNFTCLSPGNTALEFWSEPPYLTPATDLLNPSGASISHTTLPGIVSVIPEFSAFALAAVFLLATLFVVVLGRKRMRGLKA